MSALQKSGTDVLHLMPSHQYPTGLVTSIARRYALELGRRATRVDISSKMTLIVSFALPASRFLRSHRSMPPSRLFTPTRFRRACHRRLRLAYMVLPDELMERFRRNLGFYASSVSSVDRFALARLLESGDERHVNRVRVRAREARDGLMALCAEGISGRRGLD